MEPRTHQRRYVRYPQGAGGAWLRMVIYKIYQQDLHQPNNIDPVNFHAGSSSSQFCGHDKKDSNDIVFGGCAGFNFFLNFWWKKRVFENYMGFNDIDDLHKLYVLSDESRWLLFSDEYRANYCENISLDWAWLWQDISMFKKTVCEIFQIPNNQQNNSFLDLQIEQYKKSCVGTKYHVGNPFSLPWISWCHAIIIEHQLDIGINLGKSSDLALLSRYISNNIAQFMELTAPHMVPIGDQ